MVMTARMNQLTMIINYNFIMRYLTYCYPVVLAVIILLNTPFVSASDKYSGGSSGSGTSGGGSGYTSCGSGCSQGYNSKGQLETIRSSDYNRDGDYRDANEISTTVTRDSGGSSGGSRTPAPCTTYPNLVITDILFVTPGTTLTPPRTVQSGGRYANSSIGRVTGGVTGVNQNNLTLGASYEPVVEITNTGCYSTSAEKATTTSRAAGSNTGFGSSRQSSGGGVVNSIMSPVSSVANSLRNLLGGQLSSYGRNLSRTTTALPNSFHIDQMPFGQNGTFPVRLQIDFLNDTSFEITEFVNNQGPLMPRAKIYVRFPAITATGGVHGISGTVDVTVAEAPSRGCDGAEGCILERGTPTTNTRSETFAVIVPAVQIGSYLVSGPYTTGLGNIFRTTSYTTVDRRLTDRDLATDSNWNQRAGITGTYNNVGLYWTGTMINVASCTGMSVQNNGTLLSDFNGQRDVPAQSSGGLFGGVNISGFPGNGHNLDLQIVEPVASTSHIYTVTCQTTSGTTVSDSVVISNGLGGVATSTNLPNLQPESVTASGLAPATAEVRLRNTGTDIPSGTTFRTEYVLTSPLSPSLNQVNSFTTTLATPWRSNQVLSLPVRSLGTVTVNQYRVCVTANNTRSLVESNYNDNTLCANSGTGSTTPPRMMLDALGDVIRYNGVATLRYEIEAAYTMQCTLRGPGITRTFVHLSGTTEDTVVTGPIQNKQQFVLSCTPDPAVGASFGTQTRTLNIEVIPQIQEV